MVAILFVLQLATWATLTITTNQAMHHASFNSTTSLVPRPQPRSELKQGEHHTDNVGTPHWHFPGSHTHSKPARA